MRYFGFSFIAIFMPTVASAALVKTTSIIALIGIIVGQLIPIVLGLAVLVFIWGLVKFIYGAGDENKRSEGKQVMLWGIIALFVAVSIGAIVFFIQSDLGVQPGRQLKPPQIQNLP